MPSASPSTRWGAALAAALLLAGCGDQQLLIGGRTSADASVSPAPDLTRPPPAEQCNGLDDDGDGQFDEGCPCLGGATQPCYGGPRWAAAIGICTRGTQHCEQPAGAQPGAEWRWGRCEGWVGPHAQESCADGLDNDCDGLADEDCSCAPGAAEDCYPGAVDTVGVGVCKGGRRTCVTGADAQFGTWGPCLGATPPAATDTCGDGLDNDCDGTVDDACACTVGEREACYPGPSGTAGVGTCLHGTRTCVAGARGHGSLWGECTGAVLPAQTEACGDRRDNDCDGATDEGCACELGAGESCYSGPEGTSGVGVCTSGRRSCVAGAAGQDNRWGDCRGSITPATGDRCKDRLDNDCDGTVDEGCLCDLDATEACYGGPDGTAGVGTCKGGRRTCIGGAGGLGSLWGDCAGAVLPATTDTCGDRLDNDCDGTADEGCGTRVSYPDICDVDAANTYVEAAIDPSNPATWYVVDRLGQVLRTLDQGATFTVLCRVPRANYGTRTLWELRQQARFVISPAADHTAYLALDRFVMRIEALGPTSDCPKLDLGTAYSGDHGFAASPFAISARTGHLFAWWGDAQSGVEHAIKSTDRGNSWTPFATADLGGMRFVRALAVDPRNETHLLAFRADGANAGIYETLNSTHWTKTAAADLDYDEVPAALRFDPVHPGYAYASRGTGYASNSGFYSTDGGTTWRASAGHGMQGEWALNPTDGAALRFRDLSNSGGLALERAPGLSTATPSWTTATTFPHGLDAYARVDAVGQTVLAVVGLRLWVSRDGGQTFSGPVGGGLPAAFGFSSLDSVDGDTVYATSPEWHVYRSANQGASFSRVYTSTRADLQRGGARIRVFPARPNHALVWAGHGSWESSLLQTTNAFQSATYSRGVDSYRPVLALSPTDPDVALLLGEGTRGLVTRNAGSSWTALTGLPSLSGLRDAWVLPGQGSSRVLIAAQTGYAKPVGVIRYDAASQSFLDDSAAMTAVLGNDPLAGIEAFKIGTSVVLRAIGATAWMAQSTDGGATFAGIPGAEGGGLGSCTGRRIASLPSNRDVVATWCSSGPAQLATSRDGGRTWGLIGGPSWDALNCSDLTDLALTPTHLVATCATGPWPYYGERLVVRLSY